MDTLLAVYRGSDVANLQQIAANDEDDESGQSTSRLLLPVAGGIEYYIAVDGWTFEGIFGPDQGQIVLDISFSKNPFKPAPPWQLPDVNGKTIKSSDFANKVVLLNFWATWCPPCVAEIPPCPSRCPAV